MTGQKISAAAAAARESARRSTGEFGTQVRAEALSVSLAEMNWDDPEMLDAMMAQAARASARALRSSGAADRGYSVDDVQQDVLVALLQRRDSESGVRNLNAYINRVAGGCAARAGRSIRAEDFQAYAILQERKAELTAALGRDLSSKEEEGLIRDIRETWHDPRHRPSEDFVLKIRGREVGMESMVSDQSIVEQDYRPVGYADGPVNDVAPGSFLDRSLDFVEGEDRDLRKARKMAWNALAERSGAPVIGEPHLGHRGVTAARKLVANEQAFSDFLNRYPNVSPADAETFFSPWKDADADTREEIIDLLDRQPAYAYGLWDAALQCATRPR